MNRLSLVALTALSCASHALAVGLLGVLPESAEDLASKPITFGVTATIGFDSNVNTASENEVDSTFVGIDLTAAYRAATDRTVFSLSGNVGTDYYLDQAEGLDDNLYNLGLNLGLTHAFTDRFSVDQRAYVGYQADPDFLTAATINRRTSEYFFGYYDIDFNYLLTDRLTSSTNFGISGISYDDNEFGSTDDRVSYQAGQLFRYELSDQTGLRAEYRYDYTDYDSGIEAHTHTITGGLDHAIDEYTNVVFMAGASFYDNDREDSEAKPYAELGVTRLLAEGVSLRWSNRLGYEGSGVGIYDSNYSFRSNLDLSYQVTERLSSRAGVSYLYTDFSGTPSDTQHLIEGRLGLNYSFNAIFGIGLDYSYTTLNSDFPLSEYDRHRVSLGLTATF